MKFSILLNVLLAGAIGWLLWTKNATRVNMDSYAIDNAPNYSSCYNCANDDIHGETGNEFADVTARYYTTHANLYEVAAQNASGVSLMSSAKFHGFSAPGDFKDSRSCWFSSDTIKKLICIMEKSAAKLQIPSSNLGVRFYYADYGTHAFDPGFVNHHTLYMVPTVYSDKNGAFVDFEPKSSVAAGSIVPITDFIPKDTKVMREAKYNKPLSIIAGQTGHVTVMSKSSTGATTTTNVSTNQGDLCPPATGCSSTLTSVDNLHPAPYQ